MRRSVPIIVIAVVVGLVAIYYACSRSHRTRGLEGPLLTLRVLDAEFGCAGILRTPEGKTVIVDTTSRGAAALVDLLKGERVRNVTVVLSDVAPTRAASLAILQEPIGVAKLIRPECGSSSDEWRKTLALAKCEVPAEVALASGDRVRLSPKVTIEALGPSRPSTSSGCSGSGGSLVFRVRFGTKSILFLPELDAAAESGLVQSGADLTSSILVVPRSGVSLELLSMVRPQIIVVSTATRPPASVVARLSERNTGAALYRTDKHGIIEIDTNGRSVRVATEGGEP